jgi:hypothetical protein
VTSKDGPHTPTAFLATPLVASCLACGWPNSLATLRVPAFLVSPDRRRELVACLLSRHAGGLGEEKKGLAMRMLLVRI